MRISSVLCAAVVACLLHGSAPCVAAQTFESVGVRAQGMGGAFVAVADDATASWWNPAGLATGAYLSAVFERGRTTEPADPVAGQTARRSSFGNNFAVAFPALGLSYYRVRVSDVAGGATAEAGAVREDPRTGGTSMRARSVSQLGATVGQSLGDVLVIGSTLKLVRAGESASLLDEGTLDAVDDLAVDRQTRADIDVGAMANFGRVRLGATVRNLTEPSFGDGASRFTLQRQARVGVAVLSTPNGLSRGLTVSGDADLTTTATPFGDVRHVAAGAEAWVRGRVAVRGGVSANTVGERRPAGSVGVSAAVKRAFLVNASRTVGRDASVAGWSTSVSVVF